MIEDARRIAAEVLRNAGQSRDADFVAVGGGDDFPEVRIALETLNGTSERLSLLNRALRCYADPTFWDDEVAEASLAFHDKGEIARSALIGKDLYAQHRD